MTVGLGTLNVHQTWEIKWAYEISTVCLLEPQYKATSVEMPMRTDEISHGFTSTWRTTGNQRWLKEKGSFSSREKHFSLWPMLLTPVDSWIWFLDSSLDILDTLSFLHSVIFRDGFIPSVSVLYLWLSFFCFLALLFWLFSLWFAIVSLIFLISSISIWFFFKVWMSLLFFFLFVYLDIHFSNFIRCIYGFPS